MRSAVRIPYSEGLSLLFSAVTDCCVAAPLYDLLTAVGLS